MKQISIAALALVLFSLAPAAGAQTPTAFMTIDAVSVGAYGSISVTGVVDGDAAPSTRNVEFTLVTDAAAKATAIERCYRMLLVALSRPGQYHARIAPNVCNVALVTP
jgi:hypothetical protein